jgi:hypothetical protein
MTGRKLLVVAAAVSSLVLPAGGAVAAQNGPARTHFVFRGHLLAAPPANATSISVEVEGGNRIALKKMLGASVDQNFAVGTGTVFLKWSNGVPTVVHSNDLAAGDWVAVHVRAARNASLSEIESRPAGTVADRGPNPNPPSKPLFLFRGKLTGPAGASSITLDVKGGNRNALRLLLGAPSQQTFTYGAETIFLLWHGRVPTVISPSQLTVGDRVTVRIRAAKGSTLGQVEATAANRVAEHEPANAKVVG